MSCKVRDCLGRHSRIPPITMQLPFENKYRAVSQGAQPFGKRSILASM